MPPPPPPSVLERISCPVFAVRWFAGSEFDTLAYGGGGGSARTGVGNTITVLALNRDGTREEQTRIDTGDQICVSLDLSLIDNGTPFPPLRLVAAVGDLVRVFDAVLGTSLGELSLKGNDGVSAVVFGGGATGKHWCAVGCENGRVVIVDVGTRPGTSATTLSPRHQCDGHSRNAAATKRGVCAVAAEGRLVLSSARDGTARVWDSGTGRELATLECRVEDPQRQRPPTSAGGGAGKQRRPPILVRGCAFGADGATLFTCQSGRKGPAFCSMWRLDGDPAAAASGPLDVREISRVVVSPKPVSSLCVSGDRSTIAFGNVEGSVFLYRTDSLVPAHRGFVEVHDLPVTCLAARPAPNGKGGDHNNDYAVISCSADNKLAFLSDRRPPRRTWVLVWHFVVIVSAVAVGHAWYGECRDDIAGYLEGRSEGGLEPITECLTGSLYASRESGRPGISFVPH